MLTCLLNSYVHFHAIIAGLSSSFRDHMALEAKLFTICSFMERVCLPVSSCEKMICFCFHHTYPAGSKVSQEHIIFLSLPWVPRYWAGHGHSVQGRVIELDGKDMHTHLACCSILCHGMVCTQLHCVSDQVCSESWLCPGCCQMYQRRATGTTGKSVNK